MRDRPLAHAEATRRAELIDVERYAISLDVADAATNSETFGSETTVHFTTSELGATTFAEWRSDAPSSATFNGRPVPVEDGRVTLDGLQPHNILTVEGCGMYSTTGEGLHRAVDPADGAVYLYTQSFLHDASRIFVCFDQPDLKAPFDLQVSAPQEWTTLSNSPAQGEDQQRFATTSQLPPYLFAFAAGPYESAHDSWRSPEGRDVPLGLFCRASMRPYLDEGELFEVTKAGLDFFTTTFSTPMPFEKYDQLFAPEFNAGAMENPGLVIHRDEFLFRSQVTRTEYELRAMVVLHEMAHMWFGDLVSMRWWNDLWLNEAFASLCGYLATAEATKYSEAWTTFSLYEKSSAYSSDTRPSSHPISAKADDTLAALMNFDDISYSKGASVLKQLVSFTGRKEFFTGIANYLQDHEWSNTELADLLTSLESASGKQLDDWATSHLREAGLPQLSVAVGESDITLVPSGHCVPQSLKVAAFAREGNELKVLDALDVGLFDEPVELRDWSAAAKADFLLPNYGDLAYAAVKLDLGSAATITELGVNSLTDSLSRAVTWGALWHMMRDGDLMAEAFVALVARAIPSEVNDGLLTQLVRSASTAVTQFVPPRNADELSAELADACTQALAQQSPAARRVALIRAFARFATSEQQFVQVENWLAGPKEEGGVSFDADLRWPLLTALVAVGRRTAPDIDKESSRDDTAFGRNHAQQARAALPTPVAKNAAWQVATGHTGATNRIIEAACTGFWQRSQRELARPYVKQFFAELDRVWSTCDTEVAITVTQKLFPAMMVEPTTLELVDEHLARNELPAAQRRLLTDARFELLKALAPQRP